MLTVDIQISIPMSQTPTRATKHLILEQIRCILEENLEECGEGGGTLADEMGFGGNTLTLSCGDLVEEICL